MGGNAPTSPTATLTDGILPMPKNPTGGAPFKVLTPVIMGLPKSFGGSAASSGSYFTSSTPTASLGLAFALPSPVGLTQLLPGFVAQPPPPYIYYVVGGGGAAGVVVKVTRPGGLVRRTNYSNKTTMVSAPLSYGILVGISSINTWRLGSIPFFDLPLVP